MNEKDKTKILTDSYMKLDVMGRERLDQFVQKLEKENGYTDIKQQKYFWEVPKENYTV